MNRSKACSEILLLILTTFCLTFACDAGAQPAITDGPDYKASDFRVTVFARNLRFPTGMQQLSDKSLLVATSNLANGTWAGELLRLVDTDLDGKADGSVTILYTGLPGLVTSVRQAGDLIFVNSTQAGKERISVLRKGSTTTSALVLIGTINFGYPNPWNHRTYALAVQPVIGKSKHYDLFFNVGSQFNFSKTTKTVRLSGLISGVLYGDSIYKVTVQDLGSSITVSGLLQIAKGLRNAAGIAIHRASGALYFEDNGIDTPNNITESFSADELNRIKAPDIGGSVEDFGFPNDYIQYRTGTRVGSGGIQPLVAFQPLPDPFTGSESEGAVEITFAPRRFPASLRNGLFIGFHGQWVKGGRSNEENPVLHYSLKKKTYFHFINNNERKIGHPNWLLATVDSLFVADMSIKGNLSSNNMGAIYQIQYIRK